MNDPSISTHAAKMKRDWDARARENAKWFINTVKHEQSEAEFDATGKPEVEGGILADPVFIEGRNLKELRLLEIGCGIGRMTRHLSEIFGEIHAIDVSGEMVAQARARLQDRPHVFFHEMSGVDFAPLPDNYFDRIFSAYVFQHVPDAEVVRANIRDALRVLKPGGLFKFQTNGIDDPEFAATPKDTWTGTEFPEAEIRRAAREFGAQVVLILGAGTLGCWTILRKPLATSAASTALPQIEFFGRADDPQNKEIPTTGLYAHLSLILSGLSPANVDANTTSIEIADRKITACYAGFVGANYAAALAGRPEDDDLAALTQLNFAIPADLPFGDQAVCVRVGNAQSSAPVMIEFLAPQPIPPRIHYASNDLDGGTDIHAHGEKSQIRVFVYDLDRRTDANSVGLLLDGEKIALKELLYLPAAGFHALIAQLPSDITPGPHQISVEAVGLRSLPISVEALP